MSYVKNSNLMSMANSEILLSMLDALEASFCVIDANGNYIVINNVAARKISGILNAEMVDKNMWESCKLAMVQQERVMGEE